MAVTDLTGTKWLLNSNLVAGDMTTNEFMLDFNSNLLSYTIFEIERGVEEPLDEGVITSLSYNTIPLEGNIVYGFDSEIPETYSWYNEAYRTIEITGGTDATNASLIAWLQANAVQQVTPTANTYALTHSLTNLTHGNITIQLTPDAGYTYPSTLTVTNGTLVSYDDTTGVAVISGDDTTVVSGECVAQPSGYSLTFSIEEGQGCDSTDGKYFDVGIFDENDGEIDRFTITPNNPQTITWPSNAYKIVLTAAEGSVDYFDMWSIDDAHISFMQDAGSIYDIGLTMLDVSLSGNAYIKALFVSTLPTPAPDPYGNNIE